MRNSYLLTTTQNINKNIGYLSVKTRARGHTKLDFIAKNIETLTVIL